MFVPNFFDWPSVWGPDLSHQSSGNITASSLDTSEFDEASTRRISGIVAIVSVIVFSLAVVYKHRKARKGLLSPNHCLLTYAAVFLQLLLAGASATLIWFSATSTNGDADFDHLAKPCSATIGSAISVFTWYQDQYGTSRLLYHLASLVIWLASEPLSSSMGSWPQTVSTTIIAIVFVAFLLELMSPVKSQIDGVETRRSDLSLVHQSFFSWLDPIIDVTKSRRVVESDLCDLEDDLLSSNLSEEHKRIVEKYSSTSLSLVKYLYASNPTEAILTVACQLGNVLTKTATPLLLQQFLQAPSIYHLVGLFCLRLMGSFLKNHSSFYAAILATSFKATFTGEVYNVVFRLSKNTRKKEEAPVSLVEVDIQRVVDWIVKINDIWAAPLSASLSIGVLATVIGPKNTAIPLIALVVIYPFLQILGAVMQRTIMDLMERKDIRTQNVTETITNAKTIKIYGRESALEQRIYHTRQNELKSMRVLALVQGLISGLMSLCPQLMASFAFFSMWISRGCLTANCIFPILGLFTILDNSLSTISASLFAYLSAKTSFRRIQNFVSLGGTDRPQDPELVFHGPPSIQMRSVSLCSSDSEAKKTFLQHMHVDLMGPQLVTITGPVGSGKTAILDAIAGDFIPQERSISVNGIMAHQTQVPWVMSGSIRDNITFGKDYDPEWYQQVINACALRIDLGILPQGDATVVSSSGTSLSGGQKSRIALARALYSRANILLLDDPLASIDVHVRQHIIEHVFGPRGISRNALKIVSTSSSELNNIANWNLFITEDKKLQMTKPLAYWDNKNKEANLQDPLSPSPKDSSQKLLPRGIHSSSFQGTAVQAPRPSLVQEEAGSVPFSVYRQWLSLCHPLGWIVVILCIVCGRLVQLYSTYSLTRLSEDSHDKQLTHLYAFLASNILQSFCTMGFIATAWFLCLLPTAHRLHQQLVAGCLNSPIQFFADTTTGQILNRFTNDILKADGPIASYIIVVIITGSITCMITSLLLFTVPQASPGVLVIGYVFFRLQKRYRSTARDIRRIELQTRDPLITSLQDAWTGASSIKLFCMSDMFVRQFQHRINRNSQSFFIRTCLEQWIDLRLEILTHLIVLLSGWYLLANHTDEAMIGLIMNYVLSLTNVINQMVTIRAALEFDMVSLQRILEYGQLEPETPIAAHPSSRISPPASWPAEGRVEFDNVWAKYRSDLPYCLEGASFTVPMGQKVAIVGRTGAGKSSVALALGRFIEALQGSILIDGCDIAQIDLETLRQHIGVIPQQTDIFRGTLRFNLDPEGVHDDADLHKALEESQLSAILHDKQDVLNISLDQIGTHLSAGQLQLLSVARALLRPSKILVLDETTASLEPAMVSLLQKLFRERLHDKTLFAITHRLETIICHLIR